MRLEYLCLLFLHFFLFLGFARARTPKSEVSISYAKNQAAFYAKDKASQDDGVLESTYSSQIGLNYNFFLTRGFQVTTSFSQQNHLFDHKTAEFSKRYLQENQVQLGLRYIFGARLGIGITGGMEDEFYFNVQDNSLVDFSKENLGYYEYHLFFIQPLRGEKFFLTGSFNSRPATSKGDIIEQKKISYNLGLHTKFRDFRFSLYYQGTQSEFETEDLVIKNSNESAGFRFNFFF